MQTQITSQDTTQTNNVSPSISESAGPSIRIRLWDLPTRIFHWALVALVSTAIVTGEIGGEWMGVHGKAGLGIVGLVTFRLIWGIVGTAHARFANFAPTVAKLRAYLKGEWQGVGHNPLGALSVFALLGVLAVQAGTGLFSNDDIDFTGPLFDLVSKDFSNKLTGIHHQLANFLLTLLALHVLAIFFYTIFKKDNLIKPMVTGWKDVPSGKSAKKPGIYSFIFAVLIASAAVYLASGTLWTTTTPAAVNSTPAANSAPASSGW